MSVFDLTAVQLDAMLDQFDVLAGRPRQVEDLSGGLTNRNLLITTPDGRWVARCTDTTDHPLGIDRELEYFNTCRAEESGAGAPVVGYRPDLGMMLIGYIDGPGLTNEDFTKPRVVQRVAEAVRTLHAGPSFKGRFDMFERQAGYLRTALDNGYRIPGDYLDHAETFASIGRALAVHDPGLVPCNNDLLAANFVDDGERIWIIDYEYGGNNDPYFELGNIGTECGLDHDALAELVAAYDGGVSNSKLARARLQGTVAQFGWTLWGAIQAATCELDFDFWSWALERYDSAVAAMTGPDLPRLIHDVTSLD